MQLQILKLSRISKSPCEVISTLLSGIVTYLAPSTVSNLLLSPKSARDPLARGAAPMIGIQVIFVAIIYIAAGRARSHQVIAATIVGHGWLLPPLILMAGLKLNFELGLALTFASTDFLFGNMAWYI